MTSDGDDRIYALPVMIHRQGTDALLFEMPRTQLQNVNEYIKTALNKDSKGGISDGYHTFDELTEHRIVNFIAVCRLLNMISHSRPVWMSKKHSDGSEWDGWFILGIGVEPGEQITYHIPISKWEECRKVAAVYAKAPEWDGHTSADVLDRLKNLYSE